MNARICFRGASELDGSVQHLPQHSQGSTFDNTDRSMCAACARPRLTLINKNVQQIRIRIRAIMLSHYGNHVYLCLTPIKRAKRAVGPGA